MSIGVVNEFDNLIGVSQIEWLDPSTLKILEDPNIVHSRGLLSISSPQYTEDIALRIKAK